MSEEDLSLPVAVDAERSVLGGILLDESLFGLADLEGDEFSLDSHRRIFRAMQGLNAGNKPIDMITVGNLLAARKELDAIGGYSYLASLTEGLPRRLNIDAYVSIVKEKYFLRRLIQQADRTRTRATDQSEDAETVVAETQAEWEAIASEATAVPLEPIGAWFSRRYKKVDDYINRSGKDLGIETGFRDWDRLTNGLQRQQLIILAARPSMGKTAIAGNIVDYVAVKQRKVAIFYSLEMPTKDLLDRMACARARVSLTEYLAGRLSQASRRYFEEALADILNETMLHIDDTPDLTLAQMRARALRVKQQCGQLDLIIVDFLQLVTPAKGPKNQNREQEVSGISRGLKAMAKKLDVPVLALAQLGREVAKRADKRPILSDLRESGAIEQDADLVAFLHRAEYYEKDESNHGRAELITAKHRQGQLATTNLFYQASCTRFSDTDPEKGEALL